MEEIDLHIHCKGTSLPAVLTIPKLSELRGGIVPLHPASDPSRNQFLFRHLTKILPGHGIAVLRFDRRSMPGGRDVPLELQASDALFAVRTLRFRLRVRGIPIGLWGFSQGAWAAPLAACRSQGNIAWLVLLASTGVSPAIQMRYGTAEHLRRAGFKGNALRELKRLRLAYEGYLRREVDREAAQALVDRFASRPWFRLAYVRRKLPVQGSWKDMDFDPIAVFSKIKCPVLLFYGESDEWSPVNESIATWRKAAIIAGNNDVSIVRLRGTGHHPTLKNKNRLKSISPMYSKKLLAWVLAHTGDPQ